MNTTGSKRIEHSFLWKLVPDKPIRHYKATPSMDDFACPVCGHFVGCYYPHEKKLYANNYCSRCGQSIDWSDMKKEAGNGEIEDNP